MLIEDGVFVADSAYLRLTMYVQWLNARMVSDMRCLQLFLTWTVVEVVAVVAEVVVVVVRVIDGR